VSGVRVKPDMRLDETGLPAGAAERQSVRIKVAADAGHWNQRMYRGVAGELDHPACAPRREVHDIHARCEHGTA
jgi:hypothetical protein